MRANYKLKLSDFMPFFGARDYFQRNKPMLSTETDENSGIELGLYSRYMAVTLYNYGLAAIGVYEVFKGLESLLD